MIVRADGMIPVTLPGLLRFSTTFWWSTEISILFSICQCVNFDLGPAIAGVLSAYYFESAIPMHGHDEFPNGVLVHP
jgi:hypothetical protein